MSFEVRNGTIREGEGEVAEICLRNEIPGVLDVQGLAQIVDIGTAVNDSKLSSKKDMHEALDDGK